MSEYWKSTPKYWCKHCSVFVRDTKLERQNHEATGRHQGALKRFMRDLHRNHDREERDKDRAKREIERLNGVVSGSGGPGSSSSAAGRSQYGKASEAELAKQREQLAELGVSMPEPLRAEMAMPGEWTVTNTRVIKDTSEDQKEAPSERPEAKATGVRKRQTTEDQKEEEEAVRGLFKKQRKWGGTKTMPQEDTELDALLSGDILLAPPKKEDEDAKVKVESIGSTGNSASISTENKAPPADIVKEESGGSDQDLQNLDEKPSATEISPLSNVEAEVEAGDRDPDVSAPPVVFKKRKPKNIRQK